MGFVSLLTILLGAMGMKSRTEGIRVFRLGEREMVVEQIGEFAPNW